MDLLQSPAATPPSAKLRPPLSTRERERPVKRRHPGFRSIDYTLSHKRRTVSDRRTHLPPLKHLTRWLLRLP